MKLPVSCRSRATGIDLSAPMTKWRATIFYAGAVQPSSAALRPFRARRRIPMKMVDWSGRLDGFLHVNASDVLENFGHVNREHVVAQPLADSEKFRVIQDKGLGSL